jgi:hypothetical protein
MRPVLRHLEWLAADSRNALRILPGKIRQPSRTCGSHFGFCHRRSARAGRFQDFAGEDPQVREPFWILPGAIRTCGTTFRFCRHAPVLAQAVADEVHARKTAKEARQQMPTLPHTPESDTSSHSRRYRATTARSGIACRKGPLDPKLNRRKQRKNLKMFVSCAGPQSRRPAKPLKGVTSPCGWPQPRRPGSLSAPPGRRSSGR